MRIAFCIRGLSKEFEASFLNLKTTMLDDLQCQGHTIDIFLNTYYHNDPTLFASMMTKFQPVKVLLNKMRTKPAMTYIVPRQCLECIDLVRQYESEHRFQYDAVIITRFDLTFNAPFSSFDIPHDKLSMECMFVPDRNSGDNFFYIPRHYLDAAYTSIQQLQAKRKISHQAWRFFEKNGIPCHYIGGETTKRNPHYDVMFRFTRYVLTDASSPC